MEVLSFIIIAFTIYSIIASVNSKGGYRTQRRSNFPWEVQLPREKQFPPENHFPREIRFPQTQPPEYKETQQSFPTARQEKDTRYSTASGQNLDPYKDIELAQAQGYEGEWGDEGRSAGMSDEFWVEGSTGIEGTAGTEGTMGTEGISGSVGIAGTEGAPETVGSVRPQRGSSAKGRSASSGVATRVWNNELSRQDLVRGVIWSEILGRPRAMKPYRGPRG
ncbi:hypothetical protein JCM15765_05270 [Paradesulfitobacterium aromaticivorans]